MRGILLSLVAAVLMVAPQGASALKFSSATDSPITAGGSAISMSAAGDFNGDGRDDVAFGLSGGNGFKVKLSQAGGAFVDADPGGLAFGTGPAVGSVEGIMVADVNGDEDLDVLVSLPNRSWQVYLGDGTGRFGTNPDSTFSVPTTGSPWFMPPAGPYATTLADVNDDDNLDIVVGMKDFAFDVILGDGEGNFSPQPVTYFANQATRGQFDVFGSVAVGDWNGDDIVDLALGMRRDGSAVAAMGVYAADGHGDGTFTPNGEAPLLSGSYPPKSIATVRLDGDSRDDLVAVMGDDGGGTQDNVFTLLGSATGLVENNAQGASLNAGDGLNQLSLAELDHDGLTDVVIGARDDQALALIRNDGDGTISSFTGSPVPLDPIGGNEFAINTVFSGDFNGDGTDDVAADSSDPFLSAQARGIAVLINRPDASADRSSIGFGTVLPRQSSDREAVTITNVGAAPAIPAQNITITGTDADQFTLEPGTCSAGAQISGNGSCSVGVTFSPTYGGSKSATLHYAMSNQVDIDVPLTGDAGEPGEPQLTVPSGITHLGSVIVGDTATATVTLEAAGAALVTIGTPFVDDNPGESDFFSIVDDKCTGKTLVPDATCTLDVRFNPTETGLKSTSIGIPSNSGSGSTQYVGVDGVGIEASADLPAGANFGEIPVGSEKTVVVSVVSNGDVPLSLEAPTLEGADATSFSAQFGDGGCAEKVRGERCDISLTFKPTMAGSRQAELKLRGNFSGSIPLSGSARNLTPAKVTMKLTGPAKVKRGKTLTLTAKITNRGETAAKNLILKTAVKKRLARRVKPIKITSIPAGKTVTRKIRIKVKRAARKGAKLKVKVKTTGPGISGAEGTRISKLR